MEMEIFHIEKQGKSINKFFVQFYERKSRINQIGKLKGIVNLLYHKIVYEKWTTLMLSVRSQLEIAFRIQE